MKKAALIAVVAIAFVVCGALWFRNKDAVATTAVRRLIEPDIHDEP